MTADVKLNYLTLTAELQESLHNEDKYVIQKHCFVWDSYRYSKNQFWLLVLL